MVTAMSFASVEVCAGAGGQAIGLHQAGFDHVALVEIEKPACETLRYNGKRWGWKDRVHCTDLKTWQPPDEAYGVSLLAGGVPCPPFSIAGKQLGQDDDRDLFPALLDLAEEIQPRAVLIENVRGLMGKKFEGYRTVISDRLTGLGYEPDWRILEAADFGVPQLRPRTIMVALRPDDAAHWTWPEKAGRRKTVGQALKKSMAENGWTDVDRWAAMADDIAPTLVGGSKKHGGADLGPTRAKAAWAKLGVNGMGLANELPDADFDGAPKLTVQQAALIQGFPAWWAIQGLKTAAYRQVGNAFPPPVAKAVGTAIADAFKISDSGVHDLAM